MISNFKDKTTRIKINYEKTREKRYGLLGKGI